MDNQWFALRCLFCFVSKVAQFLAEEVEVEIGCGMRRCKGAVVTVVGNVDFAQAQGDAIAGGQHLLQGSLNLW
jgi:hypothetical protein